MPDAPDLRRARSAAKSAGADAERGASRLEQSRTMRLLARAGHVANGVVHLVLAGIATTIAVGGGGGGSADQSGAMSAIASTPFGLVLLWAIAVAMLALAVFAVVEAVGARRREGWGAVAKHVGRAVAYAVVAGTAISSAVGGGSSSGDSDQQAQSMTGQVMSTPFGQVLVGLVGVGILVAGIAFAVIGIRRGFAEHIAPPPRARKAAMALGVVGYVAKGVAIGVLGVLFAIAAVTHDPEQAGGLDEALTSLQELPAGPYVLLAVALGIGAYGVFSIARAWWPTKP